MSNSLWIIYIYIYIYIYISVQPTCVPWGNWNEYSFSVYSGRFPKNNSSKSQLFSTNHNIHTFKCFSYFTSDLENHIRLNLFGCIVML
jgi:hypothetical protein